MTRDDIIDRISWLHMADLSQSDMRERIKRLVTAAEVLEREACAKVCEDLGDGFPLGSDGLYITKSLARDIRARSKT